MTNELKIITGQSDKHLTIFGKHKLHPRALTAFISMQEDAAKAGFNLQPASAFRSFEQQRIIWNDKFNGLRLVVDANCQPVDMLCLSTEERCHMILRWSALPGASRHHWGTDLDVFDPNLLNSGQRLKLEPWEYAEGGYFFELDQWLTTNIDQYDFYRPFTENKQGVAIEPWHLSYRPIASKLSQKLSVNVLTQAWQQQDIAAYCWLTANLDVIFERYIQPTLL